MHARILRAVDKWENAVPLIANPFHLKGKALSCTGHLNRTVLWLWARNVGFQRLYT